MMTTNTHSIEKYTVQILNTKAGQDTPKTQIIIRLYSDKGSECGIAAFTDFGTATAPNPSGDSKKGTATCHYDIAHYQAFIDILRTENELYWKIAWQQTGATKQVSDVSLDTKEEIIGDHFGKGGI